MKYINTSGSAGVTHEIWILKKKMFSQLGPAVWRAITNI